MKNKLLDEGCTIPHVVAAATASGEPVLIGDILGVAVKAYAIGEEGMFDVEGVFEVPKAAQALSHGAIVYWDNTAKVITSTAASNKKVGYMWKDALLADAKGFINLKAMPT